MGTTSEGRPSWASSSGIPSAHVVRAALRVGALIDGQGSPIAAAATAYVLYQSDALYSPQDLRLGERLLLDVGLLGLVGDQVLPTPSLDEFLALEEAEATVLLLGLAIDAAVPPDLDQAPAATISTELRRIAEALISDPDRREAFLLARGLKHDNNALAAIGSLGEELVVHVARQELVELGRDDLARGVVRLSVFSDQLGYDVIAPRIDGRRRLEVKTTSDHRDESIFRFYVSRVEAEVGRTDPDWALVACRAYGEVATLVGWCRASTLEPYFPNDSDGGRWASAELQLPASVFEPGLPPIY